MFGLFKKKEKEGSCGTQTGSCGSSMKAEKSSCGSSVKTAGSCSIDAKPKGSCGSGHSHHHHDDEGDCSKPKGCC